MRTLSMRASSFLVVPTLALLAAVAPSVAPSQTEGLPPVPPESEAVEEVAPGDAAEDDVEVLTRGPLHEAFAAPIDQSPQPGEVVQKAPPEPIEELPPDVKPEGENVEWIPGYWAWDEEAERFIWISGVWRAVPPGREWVPGYWNDEAAGHRWVSGYWATAALSPSGSQVAESVYRAAQEAQNYVAPPPETLDVGPTSPQPSDEHFWVPGCWRYADAGYRWRPGYWYPYQPDWVWVPDHYAWTPAGCLFVPGYWDYTLQARGLAFAPVYFQPTYYTRPYYTYRPHFSLNISSLALHLFVHPHNRFYCYGDYYGSRYVGLGYRPWFDYGYFGGSGIHFHYHRHYYNPLLVYYGTHYRRRGIDYVDRLRGWHRYYDRHEHHRPARRFDRRRVIAGDHRDRHNDLARSLDEVRREQREGRRRIVEVDRDDQTREQWRRRVNSARQVARARQAMEREGERPSDLDRVRDAARERAREAGRDVVRNDADVRERASRPVSEASREQFRRALVQSREAARAARDEDRVRTRGQSPSGPSERERVPPGQNREGSAVVRGQQPDRTLERGRLGENAARESARERVMRLEPSERTEQVTPLQARQRAQERVLSNSRRWGLSQDARPQARPSVEVDRLRQAQEAARQAQDAAIARQRASEATRNLQQLRSSSPQIRSGPTVRSEGRTLRSDGPSFRSERTFRSEGRSSAPTVIDRGPAAVDRGPASLPSRQIEQPRPTQRVMPRAAPRQIESARSFAREQAQRQVRSAPRAAPRAAPQVRSQPQARAAQPSVRSQRFSSGGRSSPSATMQRGPSARAQRAAPGGGGGGGRDSSRRVLPGKGRGR